MDCSATRKHREWSGEYVFSVENTNKIITTTTMRRSMTSFILFDFRSSICGFRESCLRLYSLRVRIRFWSTLACQFVFQKIGGAFRTVASVGGLSCLIWRWCCALIVAHFTPASGFTAGAPTIHYVVITHAPTVLRLCFDTTIWGLSRSPLPTSTYSKLADDWMRVLLCLPTHG